MTWRDDPPAARGSDEGDGELLDGDIVPAGDGEPVTVAAIESRWETCATCATALDRPRAGSVRVVDIAQGDEGWIAHGRFAYGGRCPSCGAMFRTVTERIEIDCAEYTCGRCGPETSLSTKVLRLTEGDGDYIFTAALTCPKCSRRRRLTRALGASLRAIRRLRVGIDGVEVETHADRST